jgi:hypothetical protein
MNYTHTAEMCIEKIGGDVARKPVKIFGTPKMWYVGKYDRFRKDDGSEYGTRGFRFHRRKWLDLGTVKPIAD